MRKDGGALAEVKTVVLMSREMQAYLDKKAKESGCRTRSALIRYIIAQMMNDEGLPKIGRANA